MSFMFDFDTFGNVPSWDCAYVVHANNANWDTAEDTAH